MIVGSNLSKKQKNYANLVILVLYLILWCHILTCSWWIVLSWNANLEYMKERGGIPGHNYCVYAYNKKQFSTKLMPMVTKQVYHFLVIKEIAIGHQDLHSQTTIGNGSLKQTNSLDTNGLQLEQRPGTNTIKCGRDILKDGSHQ